MRAVAGSTIPIISAVGHETDTTLCDFAADVRAPTPTAAAELAVPVRADLFAAVQSLEARSLRCVHRYRERAAERFAAVAPRLPEPVDLLAAQRQRTDDLADRLRRGLGRALSDARGDLAQASTALRPALLTHRIGRSRERLTAVRLDPRLVARPLLDARERLERTVRLAASLHPDRPLQRGYARVEARSGATLTHAAAARKAGALTLVFGDGRVDAKVERATPSAYGSARPDQGSLL